MPDRIGWRHAARISDSSPSSATDRPGFGAQRNPVGASDLPRRGRAGTPGPGQASTRGRSMKRLYLAIAALVPVWSVSMAFFATSAYNDDWTWAIIGVVALVVFAGLGGLLMP